MATVFKNTLLLLSTVLLGGAGVTTVLAAGLQGDCADCHTMHNSQQGQPIAKVGLAGTISSTPNANLLKMDCIACHAQNSEDRIVSLPGGSRIPQVYHTDVTDLAAGNFKHITDGGDRKGHNVTDVVTADSTFSTPPGFRHTGDGLGNGQFDIANFTCAGSMGCHGLRGQVLASTAGSTCDPFLDPECEVVEPVVIFRTGLNAFSGYEGTSTGTPTRFSGAHHMNYDGYKSNSIHPDYNKSPLAHSYRFIARLRGYGNETDRWENVDSNSHNEYQGGYFNDLLKNLDYTNTGSCGACHINGQAGDQTRLNVPNSSMTGFCITCHSTFHSSGATSGSSGAFLRHPSDYVIPNSGEYTGYTSYNVTAPVARPTAFFSTGMTDSSEVRPGTDLVMCLSCHVAHASEFDSMLRFDYAAMTAGGYPDSAAATGAGGCLACHTTKGVLR